MFLTLQYKQIPTPSKRVRSLQMKTGKVWWHDIPVTNIGMGYLALWKNGVCHKKFLCDRPLCPTGGIIEPSQDSSKTPHTDWTSLGIIWVGNNQQLRNPYDFLDECQKTLKLT